MGIKIDTRGFREWLAQRVTAVLIGAYFIGLICFIACHHPLSYPAWHALFSSVWMKVATIIVALSVIKHTWIGLWTVFTDYVKCGVLRIFLEIVVSIALIGYFIWCVLMLVN